jgi:hypothetical protein
VRRRERALIGLRRALIVATCLAVAYLCLVAVFRWVPPVWFGRPGSAATTLLVLTVITALCVIVFRAHTRHSPGAIPVAVIAILAASSAALAFSSYARCHDAKNVPGVTALIWTIGTVKGNRSPYSLTDGKPCPATAPAALEIARYSGQFVLYASIIAILVSLLTTQIDRARIYYARSVTAIVDIDNDSRSMVTAIAQTLQKKSHVALIVGENQVNEVRDLRTQGARVIAVDLDRLDRLELSSLWKKTRQLYLLSANPTTNLRRLAAIDQRLRLVTKRSTRRLPLVVRIDDPWQAESWRAQRLGGSDTLWAANAVGIYEVTAARLMERSISGGRITQIIVCGTSQLILALSTNLARRQLERSYYTPPDALPLPALTIVANNAEEYRKDIEYHQRAAGFPPADQWLKAVDQAPSLATLMKLISPEKEADKDEETAKDATRDSEPPTAAIIFALAPGEGGTDATLPTRLAARFPAFSIFAMDRKADEYQDYAIPPVVGQLRTFRLAMDSPATGGHDAWERTAMLIHERYAAQARKAGQESEATKPWADLNEFYRGSNRRTVRNALWMVEEIAGHTWDTFGGLPDQPISAASAETGPLERLRAIGFERDTAMAMAEAEHDDWVRYNRKWGWRYAPVRDDARKVRPDLVRWDTLVKEHPERVDTALNSVAMTLYSLRELGYRSRPVWKRYQRKNVVTAEQHGKAWSWITDEGHNMRAAAGDWEVRDGGGRSWSVRDHIFRSTYEHIEGNCWRRIGCVRARPARDGETIETLEGPAVATESDWVVEGSEGEQWVVPYEKFTNNYELMEPV